MAESRRSSSSSNGGINFPKVVYSASAPYDNKTDKPDEPEFLKSDGGKDEQASKDNKTAEEDDTPILEEELMRRREELKRGEEEAALDIIVPFHYLPPEISEYYRIANEWILLYWKDGLTTKVQEGLKYVDAKILEYNRKNQRRDDEDKYPHHDIIGIFDSYRVHFEKMLNAPEDQREQLGRQFLAGNKQLVRNLAKKGLSLRDIVTPDVWYAIALVLTKWGSREDYAEAISKYTRPDIPHSAIVVKAKPVIKSFFDNILKENIDQAAEDIQTLEQVNQDLRTENLRLGLRKDDFILPLGEFYELLAAARNKQKTSEDIPRDVMAKHSSTAAGKFQLMGLKDVGIPRQYRHPGPNFWSEQQDFVKQLVMYPRDIKGKGRASAPEALQLPAPPQVRGLLPASTSSDADQKFLMDPRIAALINKEALRLATQPGLPEQQPSSSTQLNLPEQQLSDRPYFPERGQSLEAVGRRGTALTSPAEPEGSRQGSTPIESIEKKEEDVTDIDMDAVSDAGSEHSDSSDSNDEGTLMIHPGLKDGVTIHGKVMFVRPMGRGTYRVFLNAGTEMKPFLIVRNGGDFPRGFAEQWFLDPKYRSESDKPKGWKPESFRSMDFIQTGSPEAVKRAPPAYIYGLEDKKPVVWTKTEFIMRCGKSSAMGEIQKRLAYRGQRQKKLADARARRVHPDTGLPLISSDRQNTPWLFPDSPALNTSLTPSSGSGFTKIISSGNGDVDEAVPAKPTRTVAKTPAEPIHATSDAEVAGKSTVAEDSVADQMADLQRKVGVLAELVILMEKRLQAMTSS